MFLRYRDVLHPRRAVTACAAPGVVALWTSVLLVVPGSATAWSNGGYSADPGDPDYGTHDWISEHALDLLPKAEKQYLVDHRIDYLYGTELPDNDAPPKGIGDQRAHHVYFRVDGSIQADDAARRASEEYSAAKALLREGNWNAAAERAGVMSHYIADLAAWGHVMGAPSDWGAELHHSDYEEEVDARTGSYGAPGFAPYLASDGSLENISAYDAALRLARDTTFGINGSGNATWMDARYDWSSAAFVDRTGDSINKAVNAIADVLHTLALESGLANAGQPPARWRPPSGLLVVQATIVIGLGITMAAIVVANRTRGR